jgi:hypothetical protein
LLYIASGTPLICWALFLTLPHLVYIPLIFSLTRICRDPVVNFLLLMLLFVGISATVALSVDLLHRRLSRLKYFRPKLGDVLVENGHITRDQLEKALEIQRLRIGEILFYTGHITEAQLDEALRFQKRHTDTRLGDILRERGFATSDEITWAAGRVRRKLGQVLLESGLIAEPELELALGHLWYWIRQGKEKDIPT